jgi:hypothetical protein
MPKKTTSKEKWPKLVGVPLEEHRYGALKNRAKRNKRGMGAELAIIAEPTLAKESK